MTKNMKTSLFEIDSNNINKELIEESAAIIKSGGLVAFPTETVYGLGANGLDSEAVKKIFIAKGRPQDNPLILHICNSSQLNELVESIPENAQKLIGKFWPGPLTIIFKKTKLVPNAVSCGLDTVAVRMPENKIALKLIELSECPLAAPSANTSGKPSPTTAEHVKSDLNGKIDAIIDGGNCNIGLESTVIDLTREVPVIARPGKISKKEIEQVIGTVEEKTKSNKPISPGMKYKHYSPNAKVIIMKSEEAEEIKELINRNKKIRVLKYTDEIEMANKLYYDFRKADQDDIEIILVQEVEESGIGKAIMNRLKKASSHQ